MIDSSVQFVFKRLLTNILNFESSKTFVRYVFFGSPSIY